MPISVKPLRVGRLCHVLLWLSLLLISAEGMAAQALHYFPVGPIYDYRWKVLELALAHARPGDQPVLLPFAKEASQDRAVALLRHSGEIDVIALGVNREREAHMRPVKIDISRGMVGFRLLIIRSAARKQFQRVGLNELHALKFGLNEAWADVPIMEANGLHVVKASGYENLFAMLAAGRFDAFPRGLNEASRELRQRRRQYPQLVLEPSLALYFPYPIYFWVRKDNLALAQTIEHGLKLALADGSMRRLFERYYAKEIAELRAHPRQVFQLANPVLPEGEPLPDTSWWWRH